MGIAASIADFDRKQKPQTNLVNANELTLTPSQKEILVASWNLAGKLADLEQLDFFINLSVSFLTQDKVSF